MSEENQTQEVELPNVVQAVSRVMAEVGPVKKTGGGGDGVPYKFRGIDQVMNALHSALTAHGVVVVPHKVLDVTTERLANGRAQGVILTMAYRAYGPRGKEDFIDLEGVGGSTDYSDKAPNQAMSMAYKYTMLEAFCIPTEDMQDGDRKSPEVENASSEPPRFDFGSYIRENLNKDERKALAEAWKADYNFTTSSVPAEKEAEVRQLIESYKGTQPESQEIPPGEDPT